MDNGHLYGKTLLHHSALPPQQQHHPKITTYNKQYKPHSLVPSPKLDVFSPLPLLPLIPQLPSLNSRAYTPYLQTPLTLVAYQKATPSLRDSPLRKSGSSSSPFPLTQPQAPLGSALLTLRTLSTSQTTQHLYQHSFPSSPPSLWQLPPTTSPLTNHPTSHQQS